MKGWILYKDSACSLKPEAYEIQRFQQEAEKQDIELKVFSPEEFDLVVTSEDRTSVIVNGKTEKLPDFFLPRMGAGTTYFGLAIIRHLERLGVHCFNSSESIDVVKDKLFSHQILAQNNLPVPKTMLVKFPVNVKLVENKLGFPVIVKTLSGSQGSGVFLCEDKSYFEDLMQLIEATNKNANIILQEFVKDSKGRDLRVFTVGGRVVGCIERSSVDDNFKANYSRGGTAKSFEVTPEIEWLARETSRILGLEIAGIDLLFDGEHYKICEANSSPGFEALEKFTELNIPSEIYKFLRIRLGIY